MNFLYDFIGAFFQQHLIACFITFLTSFLLIIFSNHKHISKFTWRFFWGFISYLMILVTTFINFNFYNKIIFQNEKIKIVYPSNMTNFSQIAIYDNSPIRLNKQTLEFSREKEHLIKKINCSDGKIIGLYENCKKKVESTKNAF